MLLRMKWCELREYKWNEYVTIAVNRNLSNCEKLKLRFTAMVTLISFVFPQFTSFHSVFHSFHGLMNSINWPALSVWVFIAQAGRALQREHRGHGFESRWSPKKLFFGLFSQLLKLRFAAMVTYSCHVFGCKTRNSWLVRFDPSIVPVSLLLVKLSVQSIVCLFWCR